MDRVAISELISAYLDGEVTPAERAEVELLLETSPEWRAELNQFARLSDLMRALPRESAPPELAAAVRQQAERKSLLQPAPTVPKRSLRREWIAALTGMAVTAVGMVIGLRALEQQSPQLALTSAPQSDFVVMSDRVADETDADRRQDLSEVTSVSTPKRSFGTESRLTEARLMQESGIPSNPPLAAAPLAAMESKDAAPESGPTAFFEESLDGHNGLDRIHIGDVLPYLVRTTDGVAVVELTVVNMEEAGGQLELLLANNGCLLVPESEWPVEMKSGDDNLAEGAPPSALAISNANHLMTFYVNAPSGTISQVLDELRQQDVFARAKLQPPVDSPQFTWTKTSDANGNENAAKESPKDGEQALVQEAIAVSQVYNTARQMSVGVAETVAESQPVSKMRRNKADQQALVKDQAELLRQMGRAASKPRAGNYRLAPSPALKQPQNATANSAQQGLSISNNFVALELNTETGQVANRFARQPAKGVPQSLAMKKNAAQFPDNVAEVKRDPERKLGDNVPESETVADPSIRVLFVVKQAESP